MSKPVTSKIHLVDAAGIGRRNVLLPGEISLCLVHKGEVSSGRSSWWKRAEPKITVYSEDSQSQSRTKR
ncbi:hypothetical protein [Rhodocytophaga aerolata]|uniref:hypothetical protein n=1 Tax=Rhodocytophaga aerolata TaxID=455078 RepID=UPI00366B974D